MANFYNKSSNGSFYKKFGTLVNFGTTFTLKKSNLKKWPNYAIYPPKWPNWPTLLTRFLMVQFAHNLTHWSILKQWSHWNSQICKNWPNCAKFNRNVAKLANFTNKCFNGPFCVKFGTLLNFGTSFTLKKSNSKKGPNQFSQITHMCHR